MKGWVLFAAVFIVRCFKLLNNKREWRKRYHQKPLSKEVDREQSKDGGGDWSDIQNNILELILSRLSYVDFLRFGGVCTSWRSVVTESIVNMSPSPLPSLPHLLVDHLNILSDMRAGFFSLKEQNVYHPKTPLFTGGMQCLGSIQGWLIMVDVHPTHSSSAFSSQQLPSFFFWNPVSDARVMLPSTLNIPYFMTLRKLFCKVKATSGPNFPDCQVAGLVFGRLHIAFCRPNDESWSIISIVNNSMNMVFSDIELLHGKCYALTEIIEFGKVNSILVYDLGDPSPQQAKITIELQHQTHYSPRTLMWRSDDLMNVHLVNYILYFLASDPISGDVYLIFMITDLALYRQSDNQNNVERYVHTSPPVEKEFLVYKVDLGDRVNPPQVVRVLNLRDCILFLSSMGSKIVPSSGLTGPEDLIKGNTIYFAHAYLYKENPPPPPQVVKFCMTQGVVTRIPLPGSELDPNPTCLWFTPSLW